MRDARYFDGMLSTREAARVLGVSPRTLEHWRSIATGPTYSKIGRAVRYARGALVQFIEENQHMSALEMSALLHSFKVR
ncbi:MAG: helix-turn-helix domain-containing protein [Burkholderiales bacterium]|nr:helix-turn-helix domain-containing protein [Burkholderiales bacterium]